MKIGSVEHDISGSNLDFLKAIGVNHVCTANHRDWGWDRQGYWDAEELAAARKHVESHGLKLDMVSLALNWNSVDKSDVPNIICATPGRDEEIARLIKCVRAVAKAGIPAVKYNFTFGGVLRTDPAIGRAGCSHTAFDYSKYQYQPTKAGQVTADEMWERIAYWVNRVMPVADELGVRVSCHPHDPAVPAGVGMDDRVLGTIDGLKRYVELYQSPNLGLTFCQGCMAESGATTEQLVDAIRYFGRRRQLFMVHFRTIVGGFLNFREAFIDEGDIDMLETMRAYQEVGFEHMLVPDHYPHIPGDEKGWATKAYAVGYIKALMRATGGETE